MPGKCFLWLQLCNAVDMIFCCLVTVDVVEAALKVLLGTEEGELSYDAGDGAVSEGDDSCKPTEWAVCRTVVINNNYVSPSKKEKYVGWHM
eukprot:15354326-Ditylum_brightwellii.AAC.1